MTTRYTFEDSLDLATFVTPSEAKHKPIYNWFIYPHSFSPTLVWRLIDRFSLTDKSRILDLFAGAGTTVLAAKERNISAVGLDLLPISAALIRAKVADHNLWRLRRTINRVKKQLNQTSQSNDLLSEHEQILNMINAPKSIIARAFDTDTLKKIIAIKTSIIHQAVNEDDFNFLLTALLQVLEGFSVTLKAGGWLKFVEAPKNTGNIVDAFFLRVNRMFEELKCFQQSEHYSKWSVTIGDARDIHPDLGTFDAIITSPPYLNRHDYTRVLCLELLIGFLEYYDDITDLRHRLLRSHVEAKTIMRPVDYIRPTILDEILDELKQRKAERRVLYIVDGYFEDMYLVLKACYHYLNSGGHVAFVLGNVRFSGLPIPVDQIMAEIGETVGLNWENILVARRRNNSAQQMRDFGRDPSRESIVIWKK